MNAVTCENEDRACNAPADSSVMIDGIIWQMCETCAGEIGATYDVVWCREVTR